MSILKSGLRRLAAFLYYTSPLYLRNLQGKVVILTYHRVLSHKELNEQYVQPGMYVQWDVFEQHIRFLKEHFQVLPFERLFTMWANSELDDRQRYCVITFDDGWLDNYVYAFPILKRYDVPATVFLPTALIGTNHWFWPDRVGYLLSSSRKVGSTERHGVLMHTLSERYAWLKGQSIETNDGIELVIEVCKERSQEDIVDLIDWISRTTMIPLPNSRLLINWEEAVEMSRFKISFGSHSSTHRILTGLTSDEVQAELRDSLHKLRGYAVNSIPIFCYPNGDYSPEILKQVEAAGYQAAVSTQFGYEGKRPSDLLSLRRINVHQDISSNIPLFALHLCGPGTFGVLRPSIKSRGQSGALSRR